MVTVAIDGPAAVGKSTVSKLIAKRLGLQLVDTGALYRSVALTAKRKSIAPDAEAELGAVASGLDVHFDFDGVSNHTFIGDEDVSGLIRTPEISDLSSKISSLPQVRSGLLEFQRRLASKEPGAVLEGRDIGTVVLPNATAKFFLTASIEVRARRRHDELVAKHGAEGAGTYEEVLKAEEERDLRDTTRATAPLVQAPDALLVDTSDTPIEEVVENMVQEVLRRQNSNPVASAVKCCLPP